MRRLALLAALLALVFAGGAAAEERITLQTRDGVTQPFYLTMPAEPPVASLILFSGGNGALYDYQPADLRHGNFLVRSRELFVAAGFMVAVFDLPSDQPNGLTGFRTGKDHRRDIAAVIGELHRRAPGVPVWLVGTSLGTLSAANGATLESGGPDGLVLTSTVLRYSPRRADGAIYDVDLDRIRVPTLVVHNRNDACFVCPYGDVPKLMRNLPATPHKELLTFEGGAEPKSDPCEALSRHGYIGLETEVVARIAAWIKAS
jgi:pimeloyl-ACP methyl ester carboxylesterase